MQGGIKVWSDTNAVRHLVPYIACSDSFKSEFHVLTANCGPYHGVETPPFWSIERGFYRQSH